MHEIFSRQLNAIRGDLQCFNSISESSSEKHEEKISWFSNTALINVKRKTVDSSVIWTRTFENTGSPLYQLSYQVTGNCMCAHVMQLKCTRYSRDNLTLYVKKQTTVNSSGIWTLTFRNTWSTALPVALSIESLRTACHFCTYNLFVWEPNLLQILSQARGSSN